MEKVLNSSASSVVSRDHVRSILTVDVVKNLVSTSKKEYLQQLFAEEITDEKIELELRNLINPLCDWLILMSAIGIDSCESSTSNSYTTQATSSSAKEKYKLISVESTEETSSSVILGIRGQLDLVARAQLRVVKTSSQEMRSFESLQELLLPVELKTGKWKPSTVISHRAQVYNSYKPICCTKSFS